jgi:hypothetical protein
LAQAEIDSVLRHELEAIESGDCSASVEFTSGKNWERFRQNGVSASSDGVFLFAAGDSYLWLSGDFIGKVRGTYRVVSPGLRSAPISEPQFAAISNAALATRTASAVGTSARDHDPCEIVVVRSNGSLTVRATRQRLTQGPDGHKSEGGFESLRTLIEAASGRTSDAP